MTPVRIATIGLSFLLLMGGCKYLSPTEPVSDGCRNEEAFCADKVLAPLSTTETRQWQMRANAFVDSIYGPETPVYPNVVWHPCFFTIDGLCVAGLCESKNRIHVSTAQPDRTGPLVAHETLHAIYWVRFGNPDARHEREYGW